MSKKQTAERCREKYYRDNLEKCLRCPWRLHHNALCRFCRDRSGRGHCDVCGAAACPIEEIYRRINGYKACVEAGLPLCETSLLRLGFFINGGGNDGTP